MTELEHWMRSAERWKKTADRQQKEIQKLREAVAGYEDGYSGLYAMIAAVVRKAGTVTISKEEINDILRSGRQPDIQLDTEKWEYTLTMEGETDE